MEACLQLQIEKLEAKLRRYQRDNKELHEMNERLEMMIKLHEIQR